MIRREALAQIGGFAVETVTEDAHTALKFQRLGWKSAFLDIPLAAGLATERLVVRHPAYPLGARDDADFPRR